MCGFVSQLKLSVCLSARRSRTLKAPGLVQTSKHTHSSDHPRTRYVHFAKVGEVVLRAPRGRTPRSVAQQQAIIQGTDAEAPAAELNYLWVSTLKGNSLRKSILTSSSFAEPLLQSTTVTSTKPKLAAAY